MKYHYNCCSQTSSEEDVGSQREQSVFIQRDGGKFLSAVLTEANKIKITIILAVILCLYSE